MIYTIKAIPTVYTHVQFRSRLEARWAAFFDLAGIKWDYEPFDMEGWTPDFLLKTEYCDVLAEVKPVNLDHSDYSAFDKAYEHRERHQVIFLGLGPKSTTGMTGALMDPPNDAIYDWFDVVEALMTLNTTDTWREAGNKVQWHSDHSANELRVSVGDIIKRGIERARRAA